MVFFGWLLRIIGGIIVILGWFAYIPGTWDNEALKFMKDSIVYPIIATVVGIAILLIGGALGRAKR